MQTKRAERRRTLLGGVLIHSRVFTLNCMVRNRSPGGVQVRLDSEAHLASPLILVIPHDGAAYHASIAWQKGTTIGLQLLAVIDLRAPNGQAESLARSIWIERAPR
jgi:hypothetical protein